MTTLIRTATATWRALGVDVQVVVTDPAVLEDARALLTADLAALDLACSRFRADSEILALSGRTAVSPLLRDAVAVALTAAAQTEGLVDPTLGTTLMDLGYDRDFDAIDPHRAPRVTAQRRVTWKDVVVDGDTVTVPDGVLLDLGATAKAFAADRAAERIAAELGTGTLVSLGGDIATAGERPPGGWAVRVQDRSASPGEEPLGPHQTIGLAAGGLATSSTTARRWRHAGQELHHILDPATLAPAISPWRTVSVAAETCLRANTLSTAAVIRGEAALGWLREQGVAARFVTHAGGVLTVGGWPA